MSSRSFKKKSKGKGSNKASSSASSSSSASASSSSSASSASSGFPSQPMFNFGSPNFSFDPVQNVQAQAEQLLEQADSAEAIRLLRSHLFRMNAQPPKIAQLLTQPKAAQAQLQALVPLTPLMDLLAQALINLDEGQMEALMEEIDEEDDMLNQGPEAEAFQWLQASCALAPLASADKWMYLGQLTSGHDALKAFQQGLEIMAQQRNALIQKIQEKEQNQPAAATPNNEPTLEELKVQLVTLNDAMASGMCSQVELFVTDLCDEPHAESECERILREALSVAPENLDALYALANLRAIQQQGEESEKIITKCLEVLNKHRNESLARASVIKLSNPDMSSEEQLSLYDASYELRVNIAKLALEVGVYQPCVQLLDDLLEEDDRILEVSHLAAVANLSNNDPISAVEHGERCIALLDQDKEQQFMLWQEEQQLALQEEMFSNKKNKKGKKKKPAVFEEDEIARGTRQAVTELVQRAEEMIAASPELQQKRREIEEKAKADAEIVEDDEDEELNEEGKLQAQVASIAKNLPEFQHSANGLDMNDDE